MRRIAHAPRRWRTLLFSAVVVVAPHVARADDEPVDARGAFAKGVELVKDQQWGEALVWFERAYKLKPHALALFNMGVSEMRLGRLTRARADFQKALALDEQQGHTQLAGSFADEATGHIRDIEKRLVTVTFKIDPPGSALTVDGRPLAPDPTGRAGVFCAGLASPADASPPLPLAFDVVMDPGERDVLLSQEGYSAQSAKPSYSAGAHADLPMSLTAAAATIRVTSDILPAAVALNDVDVGYAPVSVPRPAGTYRITLRAKGYARYDANVNVGPGGHTDIDAHLKKDAGPVTSTWWFWTGVSATVVAVGIGTLAAYIASRPPSPYDGGSTGWVAHPH